MTNQKRKADKPLLDITSPKYLRRLAKELRSLPDGFYYGETRFNGAKFSDGRLVFRRVGDKFRHVPALGVVAWPRDAYGQEVHASRKP